MKKAGPYYLVQLLDRLDARVAEWMARWGVLLLRASLGVVFLWFGTLKLFPGVSPAEELAAQTILVLTSGIIEPALSVPALGVWECLIGIGLLTGKALRLTLVALLVHMSGTVTPLALFPSDVFVREPFVPTMVGQYIIKNLVFVSGAFVVGATVRRPSTKPHAARRLTPVSSHPRLSSTDVRPASALGR